MSKKDLESGNTSSSYYSYYSDYSDYSCMLEQQLEVSEDTMGPEHCRTCYELIDMNADNYGILEHNNSKVQHPQQMYHLECIKPWIEQKGACPICWEPMTVNNILSNISIVNYTSTSYDYDEELGTIPYNSNNSATPAIRSRNGTSAVNSTLNSTDLDNRIRDRKRRNLRIINAGLIIVAILLMILIIIF